MHSKKGYIRPGWPLPCARLRPQWIDASTAEFDGLQSPRLLLLAFRPHSYQTEGQCFRVQTESQRRESATPFVTTFQMWRCGDCSASRAFCSSVDLWPRPNRCTALFRSRCPHLEESSLSIHGQSLSQGEAFYTWGSSSTEKQPRKPQYRHAEFRHGLTALAALRLKRTSCFVNQHFFSF